MLQERGAAISGFDPTYEGSNPAIQRCYFGASSGIQGRGLILRHVLEHIPDPYHFLAALRDANSGQGLIYIEVPCLDWICKERAWFDIFYEHVNYFRLTDFHRMFGRVITGGCLFSGQYLYVVADLASLREPQLDPYNQVDFPADFAHGLTAPAAGHVNKTLGHLGRCLERRNILAFVREGRISCRQSDRYQPR